MGSLAPRMESVQEDLWGSQRPRWRDHDNAPQQTKCVHVLQLLPKRQLNTSLANSG